MWDMKKKKRGKIFHRQRLFDGKAIGAIRSACSLSCFTCAQRKRSPPPEDNCHLRDGGPCRVITRRLISRPFFPRYRYVLRPGLIRPRIISPRSTAITPGMKLKRRQERLGRLPVMSNSFMIKKDITSTGISLMLHKLLRT